MFFEANLLFEFVKITLKMKYKCCIKIINNVKLNIYIKKY